MDFSSPTLTLTLGVAFFLGTMLGGLLYEEYGKKSMSYTILVYMVGVLILIGWVLRGAIYHT
jgi:predicted MFS family arabinose efflux permease